jgi:hypothetical protein
MEKCPKCGDMTAQTNLYTKAIVCYKRSCGYEGEPGSGKDLSWFRGRVDDEYIEKVNKWSQKMDKKDLPKYDANKIRAEVELYNGLKLGTITNKLLKYVPPGFHLTPGLFALLDGEVEMNGFSAVEEANFWFQMADVIRDAVIKLACSRMRVARKKGEV